MQPLGGGGGFIRSYRVCVHGGPTCVLRIQVQCVDVIAVRSRDNVQAKCTELVVIRARMSDLLWVRGCVWWRCVGVAWVEGCVCGGVWVLHGCTWKGV